MLKLYRCKRNLGFWLHYGRKIGGKERSIYCEVRFKEDDPAFRSEVERALSGVFENVVGVKGGRGDRCECNVGCCISAFKLRREVFEWEGRTAGASAFQEGSVTIREIPSEKVEVVLWKE